MKEIYFNTMRKRFPWLEDWDVDFLNKFFNRTEISNILNEVEISRKKNLKHIVIFSLIFILLAFYYFSYFVWLWYTFKTLIILVVLTPFIIFLCVLILWVAAKWWGSVKSFILLKFLKAIDQNIEYSDNGDYFKDSINDIKKAWLLKNYSSIDFQGTSIKQIFWGIVWNERNREVTWCELKTSRRRHKGGRVTTNHSYLLKVKFLGAESVLKTSVSLLADISDHLISKIWRILSIEAMILWAASFLIVWSWKPIEVLASIYNNLWIFIAACLILFLVIWFLYSYIRSKNRVKILSGDFEKRFDVFSEDKWESRRLLTSERIDRLMEFINKLNKRETYQFHFEDDYFYLQYNLLKKGSFMYDSNYMEFLRWSSIPKNLENYVEFYLLIKNIASLSQGLQAFYYKEDLLDSFER